MPKVVCKRHSHERPAERPRTTPKPHVVAQSSDSTCLRDTTSYGSDYQYSDSRCGTSANEGSYYCGSTCGTSQYEGCHGSRQSRWCDNYSSRSRDSSPEPERHSQDARDPNSKSIVSMYMLYATVLVCILGMILFMMKTETPADSCHICDEMMPQQIKRHRMGRSKAMEVDYASDAYGAHVECHNAFHHISRETFSAADLVRLPALHRVSPDAILKDNDECFSMQGSSGKFLIRLSRPVIVQAVTLVHRTRECDTAPKEFKVYGLKNTNDKVHVNLGAFRYENRGMAAQEFTVSNLDEFAYVGLEILTNWGNREFTCIYKIKVHGEPAD